ncbi:MAG: transcriptional repressor [Elusimicrobiaceae bacterium]|nr:transcriptional repressor [Elusimicrobiaceae bacterium]
MSFTILTNEEIQTRLLAFENACRERGLRVTEQRREIFKAVASSRQHPSAQAVFAAVRHKMSNLSLDTVYRALDSLEKMNLLLRVGTSGKERFDADTRPHAHFICNTCGEVYDVFSAPVLSEWKTAACDCGDVTHINVQFKGICKRCRQHAPVLK